jgi:hypothetical protein
MAGVLACLFLFLTVLAAPVRCGGSKLWLSASCISALADNRELVHGPSEATLDVVSDEAGIRDPINGARFTLTCRVDISDNGSIRRRFNVHAPDKSHTALAKRSGRMLAILWGLADLRFGNLCSRLRQKPIDVWMMRTGEPGGELSQENIFIYNLSADRSGIEWARELAHEYGHYLLPGASGYTEPENWSNGILGERMFLSWLAADIAAERFLPDEVPFVKPSELSDYCAKQVTPLIERVRSTGVDNALIAGYDRRAMDSFTGLMLYVDLTYGSASILDVLGFLQKNKTGNSGGLEFLNAFRSWTASKTSFDTLIPTNRSVMIYLSRGEYIANPVTSGQAGGKDAQTGQKTPSFRVAISKAAWKPIKYIGPSPMVRLRWIRMSQIGIDPRLAK